MSVLGVCRLPVFFTFGFEICEDARVRNLTRGFLLEGFVVDKSTSWKWNRRANRKCGVRNLLLDSSDFSDRQFMLWEL